MGTKLVPIIAAGLAVALIAAVAVFYSGAPKADQVTPTTPVAVHHVLQNNLHVYTGTLTLPPCTTLGTALTSQGSLLSIALYTAHKADCSDTLSVDQEFSASFMPAAGAPEFSGVTLNDKPLAYTLVEGQ